MIKGPNGKTYRRNRVHLKPICHDSSSFQTDHKADCKADCKADHKVNHQGDHKADHQADHKVDHKADHQPCSDSFQNPRLKKESDV